MATLHLVNKASTNEAFARCLSLAMRGDSVFLIEDGVYCALVPALAQHRFDHLALFALRVDVEARGLADKLSADVVIADERELVELVVRHQPIVTWT